MEKNWTKIFVTTDENLMNLLVSILNKAKIHAISMNKKDSSYTIFGNIELYVKNKDIKKSKSIINLYNERNS